MGGTGNDVFFFESNTEYEKGPFELSFSVTSNNKVYFHQSGTFKNDWLPYGTLNRYIRMNGTNNIEKYCMDENTPCETVEYAMGLKIDEVLSYVVMMEDYTKTIDKTFIFREKDRIGFKGYDDKSKTPIITINVLFAEIFGLFDCSFLTLNVKTPIDTLFKIKTSTTSGGTVALKRISLNCKNIL